MSRTMFRCAAAAVLLAALVTSSCAIEQLVWEKPDGNADLAAILECMKKDGNFTMFLKMFRDTGFAPIIARYISSQPITLLAPTDHAVNKLPKTLLKRDLRGAPLVKLFESLMLENKFPLAYLEMCPVGAFFDTVYGGNTYIYKQPSQADGRIVLGLGEGAAAAETAVVTHPDLCALARPTCAVHGLSTVLIPEHVFHTVNGMPSAPENI